MTVSTPKPTAMVQKDVFTGDHNVPVSKCAELEEFIWLLDEEPHKSRRAAIIAAHPEVRELMGVEPLTKYIVGALVVLQLAMAYWLRNSAWTWQFWVLAYVVGATANQAIFLAIHEISHFLGFKTFWHNKAFNLLINLPICVPYAAGFRGYHIEHHKHQGVDGIDVDIPTAIEARLMNTFLGKLFFMCNMIPFYYLRPVFIREQVPTVWHFANIASIILFDYLIVQYWGSGAIGYLLLSSHFAGGLHPCAAHFIAEHYVFVGKQETYSYYGPLNYLIFNVGYHNEHHDFPNIPWTKLPELRRIAHEFYDDLPCHTSYLRVFWEFLFDPRIGQYSRVKRKDVNNLRAKPCGAVSSAAGSAAKED